MTIHNLSAWIANSSKATDISDRLAGGIIVTPVLVVDSAVALSAQTPVLTPIGVSYVVNAASAYWDDDLDAIIGTPDSDNTWLILFDTTLKTALAMPALVATRPMQAITADPARAMRTAITFSPPETSRLPYHAAPDLTGANQTLTISKTSGISLAAGVGATSVAQSNDGNTVTIKGKGGF